MKLSTRSLPTLVLAMGTAVLLNPAGSAAAVAVTPATTGARTAPVAHGTAAAATTASLPPVGGAEMISLGDVSTLQVRAARLVNGALYVGGDYGLYRYGLDGSWHPPIAPEKVEDLEVSADGTRMFLARPNEMGIAVLDLAQQTISTWQPSLQCVRRLAVTRTRLFFQSGCSGQTSAVGSVALADGSDLRPALTGLPGTLELSGAGSRLLIVAPQELSSYTVSDVGDLALAARRAADPVSWQQVRLSPDGASVLAADSTSGQAVELDAASLAQVRRYRTEGSPTDLSYASDGKRFAALSNLMLDTFDVGPGAGTPRSRSQVPRIVGAVVGTELTFVARTLIYAKDGASLYAIASNPATLGYDLVRVSASPAVVTALTVSAPASVAYGHPLPVTVLTRPNASITLTSPSGAGPGTDLTVKGTSNAQGRWVTKLAVWQSDSVTASVAADLTHAAATASRRFAVQGPLSVTMRGYYKIRSGIRYYRSGSGQQIRVVGICFPRSTVDAWLEYHDAKGWHRLRVTSFTADSAGGVSLYVRGARKGPIYRVGMRAHANALYAASAVTYGPRFEIG